MYDTDLQSKFFARGMVDTPIHKCHGIAHTKLQHETKKFF